MPTTLDTVRVRAERTPRHLREFEERRKHNIGRFFTDSALMESRAKGLRMMLSTLVPGLTIIGNDIRVGSCRVNLYLDDFQIREVDLDALLVETLAAMEVYRDVEVPVRYKPMSGTCAVILLWSKWDDTT